MWKWSKLMPARRQVLRFIGAFVGTTAGEIREAGPSGQAANQGGTPALPTQPTRAYSG